MELELAREIWNELKEMITVVDRPEAAYSLVQLLVDNDFSADEIKAEFKTDQEIKSALHAFIKDNEDDQDDDQDDEDLDIDVFLDDDLLDSDDY